MGSGRRSALAGYNERRKIGYCRAIAALPPRNTYFCTLPVAVFGSSFRKVNPCGALKCARCVRANSRSSSADAEALARTLETGEAHYYSRSRNTLWRKGETSGEVQRLIEMRTDCDQDAVVLVVEQSGRGAACHTGRVTCFYRRIGADGVLVDAGVPRLFDPAEVYGG